MEIQFATDGKYDFFNNIVGILSRECKKCENTFYDVKPAHLR